MSEFDERAERCRATTGSIATRMVQLALRLAAALRDHLRRRRAVASLSRLDGRMLKDIGLYRGDLDADALHRLARERRDVLERQRR